jgi:autotransporter-associated beta strand protein
MASCRFLVALALLAASEATGSGQSVFVSEPTAIRTGWSTFPVLTRGESIPLLDGPAGQPFTWTASHRQWDGLGARLVDPGTIQVYINHETNPGGISRLHLDRVGLRQWISGRVVGNTNTNQTSRPTGLLRGMTRGWSADGGSGGSLARPCGANLWEPHSFGFGRGFQDALYLSGEETFDTAGHFQVIDPESDTLYEARDVGGGGSWESASLIDTGRTDTIALLLGEDQGESPLGTARMSLYVGRKNPTGSFLERNGLVGGTTYYWDADGTDTTIGTTGGPLFQSGNDASAGGTWTTDATEAVLFSKAEDVHVDMQPVSSGFGTRAAYACQGVGVFLVDFSQVDFVAGGLGDRRQTTVRLLFEAGTDAGDGSGATGLFTAMDNLAWSADGNLYVNEDDGEGDIWRIRVAELLADYAGGNRMPDADAVAQILDADAITGLGITESSGIIDISSLLGYVPGSVFLTNGMGSVADQLAMLVAPTASLVPEVTAINVGVGSQRQRQAGYPILTGTAAVAKTGGGILVLDEINLLTGSMTVQAGTLELAHARALQSASLAPLAGGTASLGHGMSIEVARLDPLAGGVIDVGTGLLTVLTDLSPADLVSAIRSGRDDGGWAGASGITSSAAAVAVARAVGWRDNGDGSLTFGFAAPGDSNLDWTIDLLDATDMLAAGRYDSGVAATWQQGDFTYDGLFDILDVAAVFGTDLYDAGPYQSPSAAGETIATVPEPATLLLAVIPAAVVSGRFLGRRTPRGRGPHPASTALPARGRRAPAAR